MEQKMPVHNESDYAWDVAIADYESKNNHVLVPNIVQLMKMRDEIGLQRYGTRLQPHNQRDVMLDLLDEHLDALAYTHNAILEGKDIHGILESHIKQIHNMIEEVYCLMVEDSVIPETVLVV